VSAIRALAERVILAPEADRQEGPIVLVERGDPVFAVGVVLSIGQGAQRDCPDLRVGQRVLYSQDVSGKFGDKHVAHPSAILAEVDEGVTARELDARWLGRAHVAIGKPSQTYGAGKWSR
jgi:hypothetical protein